MSTQNASSVQSAVALPRPTYDDVARAAERIAGAAHKTPVQTSRTANARAEAELFFKCENLQRGGAFKFRGAYNAIAASPTSSAGGASWPTPRAIMRRSLPMPASCRASRRRSSCPTTPRP